MNCYETHQYIKKWWNMVRKIELMYSLFGRNEDGKCKDCQHYTKYKYHDKHYRKCEVYGITNSEASDWTGKYTACGLYPDKPYNGDREVIKISRSRKQPEQQIKGQMSLFERSEQ